MVPEDSPGWPFPTGADVPIHIMSFLQPKYSDRGHIDHVKAYKIVCCRQGKKGERMLVSVAEEREAKKVYKCAVFKYQLCVHFALKVTSLHLM